MRKITRFSSIIGMVANFLPYRNILQQVLRIVKVLIILLAQFENIVHTVKVHCYIKGCHAFYRKKALLKICPGDEVH
jgi:hypothetical protein